MDSYLEVNVPSTCLPRYFWLSPVHRHIYLSDILAIVVPSLKPSVLKTFGLSSASDSVPRTLQDNYKVVEFQVIESEVSAVQRIPQVLVEPKWVPLPHYSKTTQKQVLVIPEVE